MAWQQQTSKLTSHYYTWQFERPAPKLPLSYFWTWDHSANWMLDDPGMQVSGCYNKYFKQPETYLEDYRRVTDLAAGLGVKGIVIWGFLRDSHGGVEFAKRVASYARSRNVAIMPGFGTTWYGGAYYEGDHRYSLPVFLRRHPDARMLDKDGKVKEFSGEYGACLGHPAFQKWLAESLDWLFREFEIGGINFENGDFMVDYHPLTQALRKNWPADDSEVFFHQGMSYQQALEAIRRQLPSKICTYATYSGFQPSEIVKHNSGLGRKIPAMFEVLPAEAIAQWTLSGMLLKKTLPLTAWLDDGAPPAAFDNPNWPKDLRPPCRRSVGFVHQGSQWGAGGRYKCVVSWIKEACLRAYRSGLEGVSIHGEVSNRLIPYALNYLAFSHFIHWPEDTLRDFGRKTLGPVLGSAADGEEFVEILAHCEAGTVTEAHKKRSHWSCHGFSHRTCASDSKDTDDFQRYNFWRWLHYSAQAGRLLDGGLGDGFPI